MSAGFGRLTMEEPAPCHSFKSKQGGTQSRPPKPMADDSRGPQRQVVLSFDSWPFSGRFPASSGRFQHSQSAISRICGALKCWCGTPKCLSKRIKGSHRACLGSRMKIVAQSHTTEGLSRFGLFCLSLLLYFPKGLVAICGILPGVSELKARLPVGVVLGCCGKRKELGSKFSRAKNAVNTRASKWNDLETLVGLVPVLPDLYTQSFEALMYYTILLRQCLYQCGSGSEAIFCTARCGS